MTVAQTRIRKNEPDRDQKISEFYQRSLDIVPPFGEKTLFLSDLREFLLEFEKENIILRNLVRSFFEKKNFNFENLRLFVNEAEESVVRDITEKIKSQISGNELEREVVEFSVPLELAPKFNISKFPAGNWFHLEKKCISGELLYIHPKLGPASHTFQPEFLCLIDLNDSSLMLEVKEYNGVWFNFLDIPLPKEYSEVFEESIRTQKSIDIYFRPFEIELKEGKLLCFDEPSIFLNFRKSQIAEISVQVSNLSELFTPKLGVLYMASKIDEYCLNERRAMMDREFSNMTSADILVLNSEINAKQTGTILQNALLNKACVKFLEGSIMITGKLENIRKMVSSIRKTIQTSNNDFQVFKKFPETWAPQTEDCQLFEVERNSPEWDMVKNNMMLTIPNLSIQKIERVQNKTLYKKYLLETLPIIKRFNLGNKKEVYKREAEIYGWHGTSANPPENIYKNSGFDISFSRDSGYFGRAIYFANDALYSATTSPSQILEETQNSHFFEDLCWRISRNGPGKIHQAAFQKQKPKPSI